MENNENSEEEEDNLHIERRKTINKLEDFVKTQKENYNQKIEKTKTITPKDFEKIKLFQEDIKKSISKPNLGSDKDVIKKLEKFITIYNEKHKNINYEKIPDYLDKKEDNSQLVKSCNKEIKKHSIDFPLIIFDNDFYDQFSDFLEDYIKYAEYKEIYILKEELLIKKNKITNYDIFHKEKQINEISNEFIAETISTSMVDLYSEDKLKKIEKNLGIISNNFKKDIIKEMEKWVGTIYNIISDYIIFKLKDKPLYYCCNKCKKPIIFKEKSIDNIIKNVINNENEKKEIENNNIINGNNSNNMDNNNQINISNNINDNITKVKIKNLIEKKKEKDKKLIDKIIKDKNNKIEFKKLFDVANNMINLIDFQKFFDQSINHNIANPPQRGTATGDEKYNNVIYYTDNKYADFELFEREVTGAFIMVTEQKSLQYIMEYLKNGSKNELNKFILMLSGKSCEKVLKYLDENNYLNDFISCIIFTKNDKYNDLNNKYNIIKGILKTKKEVIKYLNNNSNQGQPYFTFKLINLKKYFDYYFEFHKTISQFYGQLSANLFESKINILKEYLNSINEGNTNSLINALNIFQNGTSSNIEIIKGYTGNSFYSQFNKWLYSLDSLALEQTGYFLSGLSYSLDLYGEQQNTALNNEITLYRGFSLTYIDLLPYKYNIGNIITFPSFLSSSTSIDTARGFASGNCSSNKFKVILTIKYKFKNNWKPSAVNVKSISQYPGEEERLFQCYSFFKIKNVKIDIENRSADIELETVGKTSILEEEIKNNKKLRYNYKEDIIEAYS